MKTYIKPETIAIRMENLCLGVNASQGNGVQYSKKNTIDNSLPTPNQVNNAGNAWDGGKAW